MDTVLNNLQKAIEKLSMVFSNYLAATVNKCHLLTSSKTAVDIHISDGTVSNEKRVKLLRSNLEGGFNSDFYVDPLIKKPAKNIML